MNSWGSFSQVRTPARQPIVRLSGKWRTPSTKATITICSAKHKGVKQRQVVLKDCHSPSAAMMTTNYGEGLNEREREQRDVFFFWVKEKAFIISAAVAEKNLCLCVCLGMWI